MDHTTATDEAVTGTTLCLVRHGETDWNVQRRYQGWADIPLNELGLVQAGLVAAAMADRHWDVIVSSPLSRAYVTAEAIARSVGIDTIATDDELREHGFGLGEGLTLAERQSKWPGDSWPELEPMDVFRARVLAAMDRIVETHEGKRVVVVCHGGVIGVVLAANTDGEIGTGITVIPNTSLTTVIKNADGWKVIDFAIADHLETPVAGS